MGRFRCTVSVEETAFTPNHDREIPKHSFRRGYLIHPLSCQRDSEAHFPLETSFTPYHIREIPKHTFRRKPHSPPIISDRFRSTVSFEETTFIPTILERFRSTVSVLHDMIRKHRTLLQCTNTVSSSWTNSDKNQLKIRLLYKLKYNRIVH